jgi:hypothetical protein
MGLRMKIRISFDGDQFANAVEIDQLARIKDELVSRNRGYALGGTTEPGVTSIDFEFIDDDEYSAREHIAAAFAKIAPNAKYTVEHSSYPPREEDFQQ